MDDFEDDEEPIIPQKIDYKAKDLHLYNTWKQSGSKRDMSNLVDHLNPIIYREVSRAVGTLPTSALNAEGKNWTIKAIKTFDPEKGFALSTHVTNYIRKVRRMNYKYQHTARLPENMKREWNKYNKSLTQLTDELNRDPTEEELAAHLGWSKGTVVKFKKSTYSDLIETPEDKGDEVTEYSDNNLLMNSLMSRLTDEEKIILKNKGKMSATELAAKLGVNNNRLNYLQNKLVAKITKIKEELQF